MLKYINALIIFFLIVGVALWGYVHFKKAPVSNTDYRGMIAKIIPAQIDGWTSKERPLGDTPEVERAAQKALQASDYFSREYISKTDAKSFGVYVAYWEKGKDGTSNASSHTPDRCWVENGWKNHLEKSRSDFSFENIAGAKLMPANYRFMTFEKNRTHAHVLFWFVQDGKLFKYGSANTYLRNPLDYLENVFKASLGATGELYFIRMESSTPIEELMRDAGFVEILKSLGKLALEEKQDTKTDAEKTSVQKPEKTNSPSSQKKN